MSPPRPRWSALSRLAGRGLGASLAVVGVLVAVFIAERAVPGDPVDQLLGERATLEERAELRRRMNLDGGWPEQAWAMARRVARLDAGTSWALRGAPTPVTTLLAEALPHTLGLAVAAVCVGLMLGVPLGLLAALRAGSWVDHLARGAALVSVSAPAFVTAPAALVLFAVWLPLAPTPAHDAGPLASLVLPSLVVGFALSGRVARLLRATALDVLTSPAIEASVARGLSRQTILWRQVLPGAFVPVLTLIGLQLGALAGGAIVTEAIFGRPGVGTLLLDAISRRDPQVVEACVVLIAWGYLSIQALVTALQRRLDPRLAVGTANGAGAWG